MKKIFALILALVMCFALVGCGEDEKTSLSPDVVEPAVGFSASDLVLKNGDKEYKCDVYIDDIIADFGEDYVYSEAMSCAYDGMDKVYGYGEANIDFSTRPDGDKDIVCEMYVHGGDWETSKGIKLGSSREQVIEAYGEPTQETNLMFYYILPASNAESEGASLYFEFQDNAVNAIGVTAEQLIGEE